MRAVRRVDAHHDDADSSGRVLDKHPLEAIWRPESDAVANLKTRCHERPSENIDLGIEFGVCPANVLMSNDERLSITMFRNCCTKVFVDRLLKQGNAGVP